MLRHPSRSIFAALSLSFIVGTAAYAHASFEAPSPVIEPLASYCVSKGGTILNEWVCPFSKVVRKGPFCLAKNQTGQDLIFNGCTGAMGEYSSIFFKACVAHDLCYHNEPGASGKTKEECDLSFLRNMKEICQTDSSWSCSLAAGTFYQAVNNFGNSSWNCSKGDSAYPATLDEY